jgi:hypothetical protein
MLDADLPSGAEIRSNFQAAGFTLRHHEVVTEAVAPDWSSFVRKSALRADSFLARLSDMEFDQGMAALRARVTVPAYWRFESVSLHQRVCELLGPNP